MAKKMRWLPVKDYTVALSAEYTVMVCAETMWEAEDYAFDLVEEKLKENDIEDIDTHIIEEHASRWIADEYELRLKVNMVIPVEATDYTDAWNGAVGFVENITMPEGAKLECTAQIDMSLAEDRNYLRKVM